MTRALYALALAGCMWLILLVRPVHSEPRPVTPVPAPTVTVPNASFVLRARLRALQQRLAVEHKRYDAVRHRVATLVHAMRQSGTVTEAINLACATYGSCDTLWRRAGCETGGTFSPRAYNPSGASGLFQFLPSTWQTTPYGAFSIWSPYANAMAAGWMQAHGRGGEWSCQ